MPIVFLDESGHFADSDHLCFAGYISDAANWSAFASDWNLLLTKHGLPDIHMKQIMSAKGNSPAASWDIDRKLRMLEEFIMVIRKYVHVGFGVGINASHYRYVVEEVKRAAKQQGVKTRSFPVKGFCTSRMLKLVMTYCDELKAKASPGSTMEPLGFVFDDDRNYAMECYSQIAEIKQAHADVRERVSSVCFADAHVHLPLQAADILAWATLNELRRPDGERWRRDNVFTNLLRSEDPAYGILHRSEFWDAGSDQLSLAAVISGMVMK